MDELEERARKRLELEQVRQRRVALELELEARRKAAEAAQHKLAELAGKPTIAKKSLDTAQADEAEKHEDGEQELDSEPDPSQRHAIIKEQLAQRRRQRKSQHEQAAKNLEQLNARRWELQEEQAKLQKIKNAAAAQTQRELDAADSTAREMEAALNIAHKANVQAAETDAAAAAAAEQAAEDRRTKGVVQMHVLVPADLARRVGEAVPRQEELIAQLERERDETLAAVRRPPVQVPAMNPSMGPEDFVTFLNVEDHQREWEEKGAAINRQLKKEAFERAIRSQMRQMVDEVVMLVVADVAAEGSFARFWAQQSAGSLLVDALLSQDGGPQANTTLTEKRRREKTNALIHILADYRRRRGAKSNMHVLSIMPIHPDSIEADKKQVSMASAAKSSEVIAADKLLLYMDVSPPPSEHEMAVVQAREKAHWRRVEALPIFITGLNDYVDLMIPSPDANQLATSPVRGGG